MRAGRRTYRERSERRSSLDAVVDRDRPAHQRKIGGIGEAGARETLAQLRRVGVMRQRVRQVGVGASRAADESAEHRNDAVEIVIEEALEGSIRRFADVEVDEASARLQDAADLAQG